MHVVRCIVLASVSIITVKTIKRIPLNILYRARPDEKHYTEDLPESDKQNRRAQYITNINDSNKSDIRFTDFILEAAKLLKTYDDDVLEEAFVAIDHAIWENMYNGCKSHNWGQIRRYVSEKLASLKEASPDLLRQYLDNVINIIRNEDYGDMADMIDYVNSLLVKENDKFIEVLLALVHKRISASVDLSQILKQALRRLVFDHYCDLDKEARHDLTKTIKYYWKRFNTPTVNTININGASSATPFMDDKRNEDAFKRHGYSTVTAGRSPESRQQSNEHYTESSVEVTPGVMMRAGSVELQGPRKPLLSTEEASYEKAISTEPKSTKTYFASVTNPTSSNVDENFKSEEVNKRLDKLIKIGDLAKEVHEIIQSDNKIARHGPNILNLETLVGMDLLEIINGSMSTTPQIINEMNGEKDIAISMKAKYKE